MNDYQKYKKNEIKYLEKKFKVNISKELSLMEYAKVKRDIFITYQIKYNLSITNNNLAKINKIFLNKNISYNYTYSRFDNYIDFKNFDVDFYNLNGKKYKSKLFFTNSGMSAISSLLLSIKNNLDDYSFEFIDNDIYFETYDFYNKYIKNNIKSSKKIVYIDSIAKKYNFENYKKIIKNSENIFLIIIDTTCFLPQEFSELVSLILKKDILCILVRSHTKLDMFGAEISSMGSILYLIPDNSNFEIIKNIIKENYYLLGKFGTLCLPEKFPEFIFEKKFRLINDERIKRIENNNFHLYKFLKNNLKKGRIILPNHQKFVLYILENKKMSMNKNSLDNIIKEFAKNKTEIFSACSFGFDYIALDSYYDINENGYVIRISMNDSCNVTVFYDIEEFINDKF